MIVQCCVCGKVRREDGAWDPADQHPSEKISHGYCPDCAREAFANINIPQKKESSARNFGVINLGGQARPVEVTERKTGTLVVVPLDGHMGDSREPPMDVPVNCFTPCASQEEAETRAGILVVE